MRTGSGCSTRRMVLAFFVMSIAGAPLFAWAQAPAPKPTPPPAPATTVTLPTPAAAKDSAAKPPAAAAAAPMVPALSESARAVLRSEVDRELKQMADSLKLAPEMRNRARAILLDHAYQLAQLRDRYPTASRTPATMDAMRKDVQVLRDSTDAKMAKVLTADQMIQYKKMRDESLARLRTKLGIPGMTAGMKPDTAVRTMPDTAAKAKPDTAAGMKK